jgi:hypothetical protein
MERSPVTDRESSSSDDSDNYTDDEYNRKRTNRSHGDDEPETKRKSHGDSETEAKRKSHGDSETEAKRCSVGPSKDRATGANNDMAGKMRNLIEVEDKEESSSESDSDSEEEADDLYKLFRRAFQKTQERGPLVSSIMAQILQDFGQELVSEKLKNAQTNYKILKKLPFNGCAFDK